ncbi:MAG: phage integrase N-terminal SAM-like domain-containing protein [Opitutae bacterium]|nr:phage integrase N-terminal SAM-like domain-containing protein [Opitutae bacterium]
MLRERGMLWRTEQTYREWAVRFARFIAPRSPYAADGTDVAAFLSALAVNGRASPSAQKQALNALVFLMQEVLSRDLGEMKFTRAFPKRRLPMVLTAGECRALFAQLEGTPRLMTELAYGAGLRLMELLRLRVHHLDLERRQVRVKGGKGDRVNGCADAIDRVNGCADAMRNGCAAARTC